MKLEKWLKFSEGEFYYLCFLLENFVRCRSVSKKVSSVTLSIDFQTQLLLNLIDVTIIIHLYGTSFIYFEFILTSHPLKITAKMHGYEFYFC